MPSDDLTTLLNQITRAMWDPTAPLPSIWPAGAWGVFLVFVTQIGAGIPLGVILARNAGIPPVVTAGLYLASDVVLALTMEPILIALRWLGQRVEFIGRLGKWLSRFSGAAGLQSDGVRGPLGLILFSFTVSPTAGRAASEAAGHGFISGWTLAIIGDMCYFALIMASTLWVSSLFGDDRLTIGAVLLGTWLLPMLIRRLKRAYARTPAQAAASRLATATTLEMSSPVSARMPRRTGSHNGRRRRSTRGLHR
jgi:hypothetical protein